MASTFVHIGVRATDLRESIRFWRDLLDLEVIDRGEEHYDLTDGYHNVRVFQCQDTDRPAHVSGMDDYLHVGVRVPDLGAAFERFVESGVEIVAEDVEEGREYDPDDPPEESLKVADPDGIVVDVTDRTDQWPGVAVER